MVGAIPVYGAGAGEDHLERSASPSAQQQTPQHLDPFGDVAGRLVPQQLRTAHSGPPDEAQAARLTQLIADVSAAACVIAYTYSVGLENLRLPVDELMIVASRSNMERYARTFTGEALRSGHSRSIRLVVFDRSI